MSSRGLLIIAISVALCLTSCAKQETTRYTVEQFTDTVTLFGGSFSHDEERLLFSSDESGIFNAYAIPVTGGEAAQLTHSTDEAVLALSYFPNDDRFLYMSDTKGNEIYHIYVRNEDSTVTDLTPDEGARSEYYGWSRDETSFFYGSNKRDQRSTDVYIMDIDTFTPRMIYLNDAGYFFGGISDNMRYMVFSKPITNRDSDMYLYDRETGEVKNITAHDGEINFRPLEFSLDNKSLYYLSDENSEFTYLKRYDIDSGQSTTVETAEWDIAYAYLSYNGKYRVSAINNDARTELRIMDTETDLPVELGEMPVGIITRAAFSKSEKLMRFSVNDSRSPNDLYVYNLDTREYRKLTDSMNPEIDRNDLVDPEIVRYTSFDGLEIPALLYKPHDASPQNKVPALVYVPGGPGGQSRVGYIWQLQYLINHGYAVLAVNNRGCSGYGKTFNRLDDMKHGEDDLEDCVAGKDLLISTGFVDEEKIAIFGGSYGGYMVLAALAFRPDVFAAGVDIFGISNWLRTLSNIPPWWEAQRMALYKEMGNPETDEEYLRRISPLFHAENIAKPLMVLQGANDPRVLRAESDEIVAAVEANGVPVEYLIFEDEGHGFMKKENEIEAQRSIREFLDLHLKGIVAQESEE
ncbi:alpha/beta fold hydrolase [Candidatus Eisenbacteria bacterium]|uniref:Alpha/beta fold hydrolase n=1 Tax=Eiseniibacteriota bacterium TaxID=2212470 RepID=A0ABV6YJ15_UNCEI